MSHGMVPIQKKLKKSRKKTEGYFDYSLLFIVIFLVCFGLVMIYSTSAYSSQIANDGDSFYYLKRQALFAGVGLAGLMGAGRTELAMSVFGHNYGQKITGTVKVNGKEVSTKTVKDCIDNKIAYVSEDRKTYGLVLIQTIRENMTMAARRLFFSKKGVINKNDEIVSAEEYKKRINVKSNSIEQEVGSLSGGNQQKVVLAKWMLTQPDVLILDEPTRGIDVGAKYEIYCVINDLAKAGKAVIVISSEMPEIIGTCDRVYVLNEGEIAGELSSDDVSQERIMQCIMAHNRKED